MEEEENEWRMGRNAEEREYDRGSDRRKGEGSLFFQATSLCVCVFLLHTEYQKLHSTSKVRTFSSQLQRTI